MIFEKDKIERMIKNRKIIGKIVIQPVINIDGSIKTRILGEVIDVSEKGIVFVPIEKKLRDMMGLPTAVTKGDLN